MLKKIVTKGLLILFVTAAALTASIITASADASSESIEEIDTTSTSATVTLQDTGATSYSILYSENANFSDAEKASSNTTVVRVYNLKPNTTYYFKPNTTASAGRSATTSYTTAKTEPVTMPTLASTKSAISSIKVAFEEDSEIDGYTLKVSKSSGAAVTELSGTDSVLSVTSLSSGTSYSFEACAYTTVDGVSYYSDALTFTSSTKSVAKPSVKTKKASYDAIRIVLNEKDVTGYVVYLADNKNYKNAQKLKSEDTTFRFSGLTNNKTYYIKALCYVTSGSKTYKSEAIEFTYSTKTVELGKVNTSKCTKNYSSLKVVLNKKGVTGYKVYLSTSKSFSNKTTKKSTTNSVSFTGLKPNTTYYIKTVSYVKSGSKVYYSESQTTTLKTKALPKVTVSKKAATETTASVTVKKQSNVTGYLFKVSTSSSFKTSKSVKGKSTTQKLTGLKANTKYYVKVCTYLTVNGKNYYSTPVTYNFTTKAYAAAPSGVTITNSMYKISSTSWGPQYTISWNKSARAEKYLVYSSSKKSSGYTKIATVTGTSYTVKNPSVGNHYYIIKPVSSSGTTGYKSAAKGIKYVGIFATTGYVASSSALTADGSHCVAHHTIAMGRAYAFGTKYKIGNHTYTYECEDRGSAVTNSVIDIYFSSYREAVNWGRRWIPVYQML